MSILSYPNTLPQPLQESYSADYKPSLIRTTFTDGSARQRTMPYNASDFSVSCVLMLTGAQWVDFWNFYKSLNYGADWFTMNLPLDSSDTVNTRTVRIKNGEIKKDLQFRNSSNFYGRFVLCVTDIAKSHGLHHRWKKLNPEKYCRTFPAVRH